MSTRPEERPGAADRSSTSPEQRTGATDRSGRSPAPFHPGPFRAAPGLSGTHAQTVFGRLLRRERPLPFRRERLETPDGDFVDVDFAELGLGDAVPLVVLFHGLEGFARRGYALNVYRELAARGVAAAGLNFRSCSGEPNRTARFYHSGDTGDIRFLLGHLSGRFPGRRFGAIGFSLGGNALLKYLGEEAEQSLVSAAAAVSVPFDLGAGADLMDRSRMGRFYTNMFLKTLIAKAEAKQAMLETESIDLARIRASRSFREFDDVATAPLHGFLDAEDYYRRSSSAGFLSRIRVPTLLIQADDDPFQPADRFPWEAIRSNPWLQAEVTHGGGHVGFVAGTPWRPVFWAEREAARFLALELTV